MKVVIFPALNLRFQFSQIAFSIFGIPIYKYAVCILLGIIVGLVLCRINKEKFEIDFDFIIENTILGIVFGIIGARLYYVLFNLEYYMNHLSEILNLRNGGLAIFGGLIFGGIAIFINCKIQKKDVLNFFDRIVPYVAIAQSIGRFGNFFNNEAYGYETHSIFRMGIVTIKGYIEVHPTFLYEAISTFLIAIFLIDMQKRRKYKGQILLLYCLLYGLARSMIEGLRQDSLMLFNVRISQILSMIILSISLFLSIRNARKYTVFQSKEQ